jgi:uncharacterized protein (TIRG00374 family)
MSEGRTSFSIRERLRRPSTIAGFLFTAILLVGLWRAASTFNLDQVASLIASANPLALVAALAATLATLLLRGLRWRELLSVVNLTISRRAAIEILALSFWVNVVLPAKIGDFYRAWLLKRNGGPSFGRGVGTVVLERALDLITVALLGALSGYVAFSGELPGAVLLLTVVALALALIGILVLLIARGPASRLSKRLPLPRRAAEPLERAFDALKEGSTRGGILRVLPHTCVIWGLQALRLGAVAAALGLFQVDPGSGSIGPSAVLFTALASAVLSTVPFTPAGLGIVEAGSVGILVGIFNMPPESAIALMLLDRLTDIGSLMAGGALLFAVSPFRRGAGSLR